MKDLIRNLIKEIFNQAFADKENIICSFIAEAIKAKLITKEDLIEPWVEGVENLFSGNF